MLKNFTLDYWLDDGWYVGRLREVPGVFSQGENLSELKENIEDCFLLMLENAAPIPVDNFQSMQMQLKAS